MGAHLDWMRSILRRADGSAETKNMMEDEFYDEYDNLCETILRGM